MNAFCERCNRNFASNYSYNRHLKSFHGTKSTVRKESGKPKDDLDLPTIFGPSAREFIKEYTGDLPDKHDNNMASEDDEASISPNKRMRIDLLDGETEEDDVEEDDGDKGADSEEESGAESVCSLDDNQHTVISTQYTINL